MFLVTRDSTVPLGDQLVAEVIRLIDSGRLPDGTRLPSVRQIARRSGVSVFTVSSAFARLTAKGLVQARPGSGYYVSRPRPRLTIERVELGPPYEHDPVLRFARSTFEQENVVVPAGSGFLPPAWLAEAIPPAVLARAGRSGAAAVPPPVQGDAQLRTLLTEHLRQAGIPVAADQLLITFGASHAFDLIARSLLSPGDAVLVEDPGYFVLPTQLRSHGLKLIPVPRHADGVDLAALEQAAKVHRPRMFFTQTLLHNPTGTHASAANGHGVLKLAERYDFLVTEDDIYRDLAGPHHLSLAQIDELQRVLYVGSFTKLIGPGARIGFIAAQGSRLPALIEAKILGVLSGSGLCEYVLRETLASGKYRRHVERLRDRIAVARANATRIITAAGLTLCNLDAQGVFLWARLPTDIDADRLAERARAQGILLAKGVLFSPTQQYRDCLRFNVAYSADETLRRFLAEECAAR